MSPAQVAYWEGVHAALDRDESWRSHMEQNQLARRLPNGREARK